MIKYLSDFDTAINIIQVEESDEIEVWCDNELDSDNEDGLRGTLTEGAPPCVRIVRLYVMFLITWKAMFRLSDTGLNMLFTCIATFISLLVKVFALKALTPLLDQLPQTVQAARNFLGYDRDNFMKYASCPFFHSIHTLDESRKVVKSRTVLFARCTHKAFPNHPQLSRRVPCDTLLMKSVRNSSGSIILYPKKIILLQEHRANFAAVFNEIRICSTL